MRTGRSSQYLCLVAGTTTLMTATAAQAQAQAPDRQATVAVGAPFSWSGEARSGISGNTTLAPYPADPGGCSVPHEQCDRTLLRVEGEPDRLRIDVTIHPGNLPSPFGHDLDLYVYASDANGGLGERVADSENGESEPEAVALARPRGWYLVHVVWSWALQTAFNAAAVAQPALPAMTPALPPAEPAGAVLEVEPGTLESLDRRGLRARVRCPGACIAAVSLVADRRSVRRLRLRRSRVAAARTILRQTGTADVALRPASAVRRRLRRARILTGTVRAVVRGAAGGEQVLTQRVVLRN